MTHWQGYNGWAGAVGRRPAPAPRKGNAVQAQSNNIRRIPIVDDATDEMPVRVVDQETGEVLDADRLGWEEDVAEGIRLREKQDGARWELGALAARVGTRYGDHTLKTYAAAISVGYSALRDYLQVSKRFVGHPTNLSWSHHQVVAARDDAEEWLDRAEAEGWSVARLRRELALPEDDDQDEDEADKLPGDEWYTPRWLFDALGLHFTLDVCSPIDRMHSSVPADGYLDESDDGLSVPWVGLVWCNPPYSTPAGWAERMIQHGNGLMLTHVPINAAWAKDVWDAADGVRLFQAMEFVRPDGTLQRPGYWLMLAAFGEQATAALSRLAAPPDVAENPRRVPSPMWVRA